MSTATRGRPPIPEQDLINELHRLADTLDKTPCTSDMETHGKYSARTYYNRFGTWTNALAEIGHEPNTREASQEDLRAELSRLNTQLGHTPRRKDMKKHGEYGAQTYDTHFGTWTDALDEVGLEPHPKGRKKITPDELITELHRLADTLEKTPTTTDMKNHGKYGYLVYYSRFDSWPDALSAAGLEDT